MSHREEVAALVNAEPDECVIVVNTTHGINNIMRNIEWRTGDVILDSKTMRPVFGLRYTTKPMVHSHGNIRSCCAHRTIYGRPL